MKIIFSKSFFLCSFIVAAIVSVAMSYVVGENDKYYKDIDVKVRESVLVHAKVGLVEDVTLTRSVFVRASNINPEYRDYWLYIDGNKGGARFVVRLKRGSDVNYYAFVEVDGETISDPAWVPIKMHHIEGP